MVSLGNCCFLDSGYVSLRVHSGCYLQDVFEFVAQCVHVLLCLVHQMFMLKMSGFRSHVMA